MDKRYIPFPIYEDNVNQIISADHINATDDQVQQDERSIFELRDSQFLDQCLFILGNHPVVNTLWYDDFSTRQKFDQSQLSGLQYTAEDSSFALAADSVSATLLSLPYTPGTGSLVQNVILMVDAYIPEGTSVVFSISNNGSNFYPITPNQSTEMSLNTLSSTLVVRADLRRSATTTDSPVLYAWAVLYEDKAYTPYIPDSMLVASTPITLRPLSHTELVDVLPDQHHPQLHHHDGTDGSGLVSHRSLTDIGPDDHHPKIHHHLGLPGENDKIDLQREVKNTLPLRNLPLILFTGIPGTTQLLRDIEGNLQRAITPEADVYLFRNAQDTLSRVVSVMGDYYTDELLDYEPDPDNPADERLLDVRKYIKDVQVGDLGAIIHDSTANLNDLSAWTIPYNPSSNTSVPMMPTSFQVTLATPNQPAFTWTLPNDPTIMGVLIYYAFGANIVWSTTDYWKSWTYILPPEVSSFSEPYTLDPGNYSFALVTINQDGRLSDPLIAKNTIQVV